MTGTPLDLTPFGPLLKSLGYAYWLIAFGLAGFALWVPGRWRIKAPIAVLILGGFAYPVITHRQAQQRQVDVAKARLDEAMALFKKRCESSGEKITRAVENVEGVVWMKWRDKMDVNDDYDQFKLSDPYGRDCNAEGCIEQLLRATERLDLDPQKMEHFQSGYRFVESIDPATNQPAQYKRRLYRPHDRDPKYTETLVRAELSSQPIKRYSARYGITWDDISTREDREHWIAGGSLKVIDLQTNDVIAERIGYMMDRGLGSKSGGRSPWMAAPEAACPAFRRAPSGHAFMSYRSHEFIFNVLKPKE